VAADQGLRVLAGVGLAGEQLTAFLDDRKTLAAIRRRCADEVRACAGHPALLAYAVGNEIPSSMARWHGRRRVERFLRELTDLARQHDPGGLVTYVNYPTTEYLQLPFLDFLSYNVYLESPDRFDAYLARLQSIADGKPLLMAEVGLDSLRNGPDAQATAVGSQVRSSFAGGCAGVFVFAWTDEWHTGGCDVEEWRFGVTDAQRQPKPALHALKDAFAQSPLPDTPDLPRISVVVCTYNGGRTIAECLGACARLRYPNFEVIVVNDGSTDGTADVVRQFDVRLINTPNHGLSHARNVGLRAATGEIIAYVDDDARPDEHWLRYLAHTFQTSGHAGVGGPNIVPQDDPPLAHCVAHAPGGPTHVLITDRLAEHIPGCNMSFRTRCLREVGGFDPQFRIAGDDVDVCWRLQARGWTLGFHPAAVVWHRRRASARAYWRQQFNYGRAEAMLEQKWPEKYNAVGHVGWRGRLYGSGTGCGGRWLRSRVYHGVWASSPFQTLCEPPSAWSGLTQMPEWYLGVAGLLTLGAFGGLWRPLLACLPVAALAAAATVLECLRGAARASFPGITGWRRRVLVVQTAALHLVQPVARLGGRLSDGLTPWRRRVPGALALPRARTFRIWSEQWQSASDRLATIEALLRQRPLPVRRGGEYDDWDLEVRGGLFASARTRLGVEEYPRGRQYLRFRVWPCLCTASCLVVVSGALAVAAAVQRSPAAAFVLASFAALLLLRTLGDYGAAAACLRHVFGKYEKIMGAVKSAADTPPPAAPPDARGRARPAREDHPTTWEGFASPAEPDGIAPPPDHRPGLVARLAHPDVLELSPYRARDDAPERAG
jgi:GT2 family glycosyltransferase